jgi:hypothetical protein
MAAGVLCVCVLHAGAFSAWLSGNVLAETAREALRVSCVPLRVRGSVVFVCLRCCSREEGSQNPAPHSDLTCVCVFVCVVVVFFL